jgi:hypothetical protein
MILGSIQHEVEWSKWRCSVWWMLHIFVTRINPV